MFKYIFMLFYMLDVMATEIDPCTKYSTIEDVKRSAGYTLADGDIAISDDRLTPGWYRIVSDAGEEMPITAPGYLRCKTLSPIWLHGVLPTTANEQVAQPVCLQSIIAKCSQTWNIIIKRCTGNFLVYNLTRSPLSQSAYCFGTQVKCPDGQYSETGYSPGCTTQFPADRFTPVVVAELAEGVVLDQDYGQSLEAVFNCSFADIPGTTYAYDVYWYINDFSVVIHRRILYSSINQTLLRPAHWVDKYQMNMVVKCAVRARLNATSVPGPYSYSKLFEAGVKSEKTVYEVLEGKEILIPVKSSVPVGCVGSTSIILPHCIHTLKIAQPNYQSNPSETCGTNIKEQSLVFETQDCGVTFSTTNWNIPVNLKVTGYVDNIYNSKDRTGYIRLTSLLNSTTDVSRIWNKVNIPDIQVVVRDRDSSMTSRQCTTWNDPLYTTADGSKFTYNGFGENILYRHKRYPFWVHTLTTLCWEGASVTCNCGIAIRSHDSLFVVRTCDVISTSFYASGRYYPSISYQICDNQHMVIEKTPDGYQVTLPIGTIISFRVSGSRIPLIIIKPSTLDIEQSEGLCGFISKTIDTRDDFIPRGANSSTTDNNVFAKSWRVLQNSSEELFSPLPNFPSEDLYLKEYCLCAEEANENAPIAQYNNVKCNLTQPMILCKSTKTPLAKTLYQECHKSRKRRDTGNSDDIVINKPLTYAPDFDPDFIPLPPVWRNGWNEDSARQACKNGISQMAALELCKKHAQINETFYIESCVNDVKIAGGTTYMTYTIWLIEDTCRLEISKNESLFRGNSSSGGETVLSMIKNLLCPSNCSNNGMCIDAECVCNHGYIGWDCSTTLADSPKNLTIPDDGLCSTKYRQCKQTNVFGVFHAEKVYCRFKHFTVTEFGKVMAASETVVEASYRYENLVSCEFPNSRKKRSTTFVIEGFDMALSYDSINYGDSMTIIIYDEDCFICNTTTVTCVARGTCTATTVASENGSKNGSISTVIGAVVGVLGVVILLTVILVIYKYKSFKDRQKNRERTIIEPSAAPRDTQIPYRRDDSNLSITWKDNSRLSTPADLFRASSFDKQF